MDHISMTNVVNAQSSEHKDVVMVSIPSQSLQTTVSKTYDRRRSYHSKHPWVKYVCWARRRCSPVDSRWKPYYFDRGIECHINAEDTKKIWFRDRAKDLARPSLDGICSKFGYTPWNIGFIEFNENVRLSGGRF